MAGLVGGIRAALDGAPNDLCGDPAGAQPAVAITTERVISPMRQRIL